MIQIEEITYTIVLLICLGGGDWRDGSKNHTKGSPSLTWLGTQQGGSGWDGVLTFFRQLFLISWPALAECLVWLICVRCANVIAVASSTIWRPSQVTGSHTWSRGIRSRGKRTVCISFHYLR